MSLLSLMMMMMMMMMIIIIMIIIIIIIIPYGVGYWWNEVWKGELRSRRNTPPRFQFLTTNSTLPVFIFWDIEPCILYVNLCFGRMYINPFPIFGVKNQPINKEACSRTLKMEVMCSSKTSVCIRTTRRYIPEGS
jgi:hypothetical protein